MRDCGQASAPSKKPSKWLSSRLLLELKWCTQRLMRCTGGLKDTTVIHSQLQSNQDSWTRLYIRCHCNQSFMLISFRMWSHHEMRFRSLGWRWSCARNIRVRDMRILCWTWSSMFRSVTKTWRLSFWVRMTLLFTFTVTLCRICPLNNLQRKTVWLGLNWAEFTDLWLRV